MASEPRGGQRQLQLADDACHSIVVAMALGGLDCVDDHWRKWIAEGGLNEWAQVALEPDPRPTLPRRPRWSSSRVGSRL